MDNLFFYILYKMYDKIYFPYPSTDKRFKFLIINEKGTKIRFGASGYNDYTTYYKDYGKEIADEHKLRYIQRHQNHEDWGKSGVNTKGYWAKSLLWSYPTKEEAYEKIKKDLLKWGYITKEQYNNNIYI